MDKLKRILNIVCVKAAYTLGKEVRLKEAILEEPFVALFLPKSLDVKFVPKNGWKYEWADTDDVVGATLDEYGDEQVTYICFNSCKTVSDAFAAVSILVSTFYYSDEILALDPTGLQGFVSTTLLNDKVEAQKQLTMFRLGIILGVGGAQKNMPGVLVCQLHSDLAAKIDKPTNDKESTLLGKISTGKFLPIGSGVYITKVENEEQLISAVIEAGGIHMEYVCNKNSSDADCTLTN